ncbi:MAG: hypothetical protein ACLFMX_08305 [Halobacteriales archaeon]
MRPLATAGEHGLELFGPGTVVIFAIVLAPIYIMLAAWFVGSPRDLRTALLGVGYLAGITVALWGGLFVATMVLKFLFL